MKLKWNSFISTSGQSRQVGAVIFAAFRHTKNPGGTDDSIHRKGDNKSMKG